nr:hypothetical protein [Tanacetum cinerariifolium]
MSKSRFASQVDVNNNLSRPVTQHYFPKRKESVFAKPDHLIASSESRNSSKNMTRFSSNNMVHNQYLDEARKKTQERDRNSKTSVMSYARFQITVDGSKPKPRSTNHSTISLPEVNSRAKIQSHKTRNSNKPVDQKSHTQKPGRQIFTRHRFSPNKTSVVYKKTSPRSDLMWKPTGRIFKSVGVRWIPTGKLFDSCTSKDGSEPTHGSNADISNIHESKQTLDLSACTSINVQKEQGFDLSAGKSNNVKPDNLRDEEVAMVDGVFEGAFRELGDKTCLLEGLEMKALVDAWRRLLDFVDAFGYFHDTACCGCGGGGRRIHDDSSCRRHSVDDSILIEGKVNGVNIFKSIDEGPFQMGTVRETLAEGTERAPHLGLERPRVYSELSFEEKDRYNTNIRATNILLQGLPKDIYTLINHYTDAKDIWDNVTMLLEGSELTKEDRESQLYDDFENFQQNQGETIHAYYVRDSNYDQLYAYLKQHEAHANENKMMLDRFTQHTVDPLALMSNVSHQQPYSQSSITLPSTYVPPHLANNAYLDSGLSLTDNLIENLTNTLALLTQSYKTFLPQTNNQLRTSLNTRNQATVQDGRVVVQNVQGRLNRGQGNNPWGGGHIARNCTKPKRPQNSDYFKDKMLQMQAQENGVALDEEQLLFLADDCDTFDSDVDEALMAQTMFMANLSSEDPVYDEAGLSYDSDILSEVHDHDHYQDAVCEHHEELEMHDN